MSVAWIVAIEAYSGPELNVGPVGSWALQIARTMLDKGVQKIVLSTSFVDARS